MSEQASLNADNAMDGCICFSLRSILRRMKRAIKECSQWGCPNTCLLFWLGWGDSRPSSINTEVNLRNFAGQECSDESSSEEESEDDYIGADIDFNDYQLVHVLCSPSSSPELAPPDVFVLPDNANDGQNDDGKDETKDNVESILEHEHHAEGSTEPKSIPSIGSLYSFNTVSLVASIHDIA